MAKAASPVRLEAKLMQAASMAGERHHRSAAEQIEYWASVGRSVAAYLNPDTLLAITSGLAKLHVESVNTPVVNPEDVFSALEQDRDVGTLAPSVSNSAVRYQVSVSHPGQLEQIHADGKIVIGQFNDGVFTPMGD